MASDPLIWLNLGNVLGKLQQYVHAIGAYDKTIALGANEPLIWYNRGNALTKLGRYEEAVQSYDRLLKIKPDDSEGMGAAMLYTSWNAIKMLWLPTIGPWNYSQENQILGITEAMCWKNCSIIVRRLVLTNRL
ncbi:MAG: tetratricopeptide repeat protein [Hormoscilla sp. GM102CHS1]|nr:tetratricopeptide repeat protein [Hormoscilla sp. GM102CHS1]